MENRKWNFYDIPEEIQEKIRLMESFGNLILGGIALFACEQNRIEPVYLSPGLCGMFYNIEDLLKAESLEECIKEKHYDTLCRKVEECIENHTTLDYTMPYPMAEKSRRWIWIRGREVLKRQQCHFFIALIQDVTKQKQLENELAAQNERYRLLEETSDEILFELDLMKDVMNYSFKEMDGNLIRQRISHYHKALEANPMIHPDYIELFRRHLSLASKKKTEGQIEYLSKISGHGYEWHRMYYNSLEDGDGMINRIVGRIKNIHDEVLNRRQAADSSSNYVNSGYSEIQSRIVRLLDNADLEDTHSLLLLSVNHFKKITEQNGVACGDVVMRHVLDILQTKMGQQAVFGRVENGKVLIYLKNISAQELDEKVHEVMTCIQNVDYQIADLHPTCSVGAAIMCGAADFVTFYYEVEEALHIAKLTKGERYIRV